MWIIDIDAIQIGKKKKMQLKRKIHVPIYYCVKIYSLFFLFHHFIQQLFSPIRWCLSIFYFYLPSPFPPPHHHHHQQMSKVLQYSIYILFISLCFYVYHQKYSKKKKMWNKCTSEQENGGKIRQLVNRKH